jgi:hypothetical protein
VGLGEGNEETEKRGDLATTPSGTITNKPPQARRSMNTCRVGEGNEETEKRGNLATAVTNKEPLSRRSMGRCSCR